MDITAEKRLLAEAMKRAEQLARRDSFDPHAVGSKPTEKQEEILRDIVDFSSRYCVAANQTGKTMIGAREAAWMFTGTHPYLDTKALWGDRPLTMLVLGQTTAQLTTEIWERKLEPHLIGVEYKKDMSGGVIQSVTHKKNGNKIIFISHHNANDARKNAQSFVAQWVWLDEMPQSLSLFAELETRTIATKGKFLCTFTPLIRNLEIKNKIENGDPSFCKKYRLAMLDNPIYKGREEEMMARYATLPEGERNARLYGEWYVGERGVYRFDPDLHVAEPVDYHQSWRHVEVVDPAASGFSGYALLAEDPITHKWYAVKAQNVEGRSPTELIEAFRRLSYGVNLIKRISDPHEAWFIKEAARHKLIYTGVYNKNNYRKLELIKQLQERLDDGKLIITPWAGQGVLEQFLSCQWSETRSDKIVRASDYHILDCLQYFCDSIPKPEPARTDITWEQNIQRMHRERLAKEAKTKDKPKLTFGSWKPRVHRRSY